MTIEDAKNNIGRNVVYTPFERCKKEVGVITEVNSKFAFVRYGSDFISKATDPSDLELEVNV